MVHSSRVVRTQRRRTESTTRTLLALIAVGSALASDTRSRAADPSPAEALTAALPAALRPYLRPLPPVLGPDLEDRLAWVALLARRADARAHYSDERAWRAVMGWTEPGDTPFTFDRAAPDRSPARYPVPAGRADPATDLAASVALAALRPKDFSCTFPTRARFLAARGLAPTPLPLDTGACTAFETWADLANVDGIELVYVTPTWGEAAASMGHVIFRVRRANRARMTGQSFEPTFAFAAMEDATKTPFFVLRGMVGGLRASLKIERFGDVYRRYAVRERRDLVLYDLALSATEIRTLLAEVWAGKKTEIAIPYAFFTQNCATMAYDLLRRVVPSLPDGASILMHPHEVVSNILLAGRARPRAIIPARRTRAIDAEAARDALGAKLGDHPGLAALQHAHAGDVDARAAALRAFAAILDAAGDGPLGPNALDLAAYVDAWLDLETWAVDAKTGGADPAATSPALDAALDLRARLPLRPEARVDPFPAGPSRPDGSRRSAYEIGLAPGGRATARFAFAVIDEEAGEARQVSLRRTGRMTLLRSETTLSTDGRKLALEQMRLTLIDQATWGWGPRIDQSWFASRLGFAFSLTSLSRPREGMPFALTMRFGAALTLAASRNFSSFLVAGLGLDLSHWGVDGYALVTSAGPFVEAAAPLGPSGHRLSLRARALPGWAFDHGVAVAFEADLGLDLVLDGATGLLMRLRVTGRSALPTANGGNGWSFGMGLSW